MYIDEIPLEANNIVEYARNHPKEAVEKIKSQHEQIERLKEDINDMRVTGEVVFIRHVACGRLYSEDLRECPHCDQTQKG